jgi:hypothetical protein
LDSATVVEEVCYALHGGLRREIEITQAIGEVKKAILTGRLE